MDRYIKYIVNGIMCIAGGILTAVFLVSDRWMRDPNVYSEELGRTVHRFDIGFHWTTLAGMAGVVLLVAGAACLMKVERHILGITAIALTVVNLCSWSFFASMSETYFELVLGAGPGISLVYRALKLLSAIVAAVLLAVMLTDKKKKKNSLSYRILAAVVLILSSACLIFITICNRWYLFQAGMAAGVLCFFFFFQNRRTMRAARRLERNLT